VKVSKQEALAELWRRGILTFKLDKNQKELYDLYHNGADKINTWLLARRSGKSYTLLNLAIEVCLKKPNAIVKYLAPTKLMVKQITEPLMEKLLRDCPEEFKPEFKTQFYTYYFPNGSQIQMAGSDGGHAEKLRGTDADLVIIDEAGSVDDLDYIIKSILIPTTLITKGKLILASTPPREGDHPFISYIESAEAKGTLIRKTIYDNPRLVQSDIDLMAEAMGGVTSHDFQRECLCLIVKDPTLSVIPEFTPDLEVQITKEWPKPPFYDAYVGMDLGGKDLTAVLFAYYDFRADKVIVEDEIRFDFTQQDNHLKLLTEKIEQKEESLWKNPISGELKTPYLRVSDINYIAMNEISSLSKNKISFVAARKDDKDSAINTLRIMLAAKKIIIHPRCTMLLQHLRNVKWASKHSKKDFARSTDDGHYDAVDALIYLIRSVAMGKNPYPPGYGYDQKDLYINNKEKYNQDNQIDLYKSMFGIKTKKRHW
jgi:hypothetical protein